MRTSYAYNAQGRLAELTHRDREGILDRYAYRYDLRGNKTAIEKQRRGLPEESGSYAYAYDKRGNLSLIMENGALKNQYVYGALNRLEQAVNAKGETALYTYNGLGHRVGKTTGAIHPEKEIQYTIDLTRSYHNLLQKEEDGNTQSYLWDRNVAGMTEDGQERYYLQDEMGSPIRLMDKDGDLEDSYGYDEFDQDLYGNQGPLQPFGYTGY